VVTEYGVADLRGKSDRDVIAGMLAVADSRFQDELLRCARDAGKIEQGFELPAACRDNTPERIARALAPARDRRAAHTSAQAVRLGVAAAARAAAGAGIVRIGAVGRAARLPCPHGARPSVRRDGTRRSRAASRGAGGIFLMETYRCRPRESGDPYSRGGGYWAPLWRGPHPIRCGAHTN